MASAAAQESASAMGSTTRRYASMSEYCSDLRTWMGQVQQARCMEAMFPVWLSQQLARGTVPEQPVQHPASSVPPPRPAEPAPQPQRGLEFRIPPLWKRLVAEMVDFCILMIMKFIFVYIAIDQFELIDLSKYDVDTLMKVVSGGQNNMNYTLAMEMTSELLLLEMINRVSVCWFEALCLHRGWGRPGGATPGKYLVNIRVVRCEWVVPSMNDHVVLAPGDDIGFSRALLRSVIKNISVTFFFTMFAAMFYLDHNRAPYDLLAGTVVVEGGRR